MEVEIHNTETEEIYTTGRSSLRTFPEKVIHSFFVRMFSLSCAHDKRDIIGSLANDYRDGSFRLRDNYRIKVEEHLYHWVIKEIFKEEDN